ncbi:hypothetical protein P692DRAFT_20738522, partial [Suillus brevipes Sb2]
RDEVGLVRAITVKERSSASRKQLFKDIQTRSEGVTPVQLLLDMPICWSSTYVMLDRAEKKKQFVDTFIYELGKKEMNLTKRAKIDALKLESDEWDRVKLFVNLLAHADNAQQAFSSDTGPALYFALPALEGLHKAWTSCSNSPKYARFHAALTAATDKIHEYYEKSAECNAYIVSMLLDPNHKDSHFKRFWGKDLHKEVLEVMNEIERYIEIYGENNAPLSPRKRLGGSAKLASVLRELSSDEDSGSEMEAENMPFQLLG